MVEVIREPTNGIMRANSAAESVFTDGDEIWLRYPDNRLMSADADAVLRAMERIEEGKPECITVGGLCVSSRTGAPQSNPVYLVGYDEDEGEMYKQNTNADEVRAAVEQARG